MSGKGNKNVLHDETNNKKNSGFLFLRQPRTAAECFWFLVFATAKDGCRMFSSAPPRMEEKWRNNRSICLAKVIIKKKSGFLFLRQPRTAAECFLVSGFCYFVTLLLCYFCYFCDFQQITKMEKNLFFLCIYVVYISFFSSKYRKDDCATKSNKVTSNKSNRMPQC